MSTTAALAVALIFLWLGIVLAISFIEAPLKFRAPGVTLPIGLGIGRLVFRAVNGVEVVLALVIGVTLVATGAGPAVLIAFTVAAVALAAQLLAVRPALTKRSDAVLAAGPDAENLPRSQAHVGYVGLELVKVIALITAGTVLLAG